MTPEQQRRRQEQIRQQRQRIARQKARRLAVKRQPPQKISSVSNVGYTVDPETVEKFNKTVYIVGGGPSLEHFNWNLLDHSYFVIGINTAYSVLPEAQIIYFTDDDWYDTHCKQGFLDHPSVKIKGSLNPGKLNGDTNIRQMHLKSETGLETKPNMLRHGRNSPYAAINMVIQWGFKTIYLMGIDMQHGRPDPKSRHKKKTHFHAGHRRVDPESAFPGFLKNYNNLVKLIEPIGVKIININDHSKLEAFPTETYEEHFGKSWSTKK